MVAESLYMPNTYYRFIPNPTTFSWNRKNFSARKLLREFIKAMRPDSEFLTYTHHMMELQAWGEELDAHLKNWADEDDFSMGLLQSLDACVKKCDAYLTPPEPTLRERMVTMTKLVVREHVQEVMKLLNEIPEDVDDAGDAGDDSTLASKDPRHGGHHHAKRNTTNTTTATTTTTAFEELNSAAPEVRQGKLVEIYFTTVRRAVAENVPHTLQKRHTGAYVPSVASRSNLVLDMVASGGGGGDDDSVESPAPRSETPTPQLFVTKSGGAAVETVRETSSGGNGMEAEAQLTEEIWCTLVFRMLCWLLLHDFHKKDVQISKSELFGSRLPVYIA